MFRIHFADGRVVAEHEARWSQLATPIDLGGRRYWVLEQPATAVEVEAAGLTHRLDLPVSAHLVYHYDRVAAPVLAGGLGTPVVLHTAFGVLFPNPPAYGLLAEVYPDGRMVVRLAEQRQGVSDAP